MSMMSIIFLCIYLLSFGITSVSLTDCGQRCELCDDDENKCIVCKQGFYKSGHVCNLCSNGCLSCQNDDVCDICKDGFGLTNGTCQPCLKGCRRCAFEERIKCVSCFSGYYVDGDICKSCTKDSIACSCSGATFWNGFMCSLCPIGCTRCSSSQSCSECKSGYYGKTCHYPCSEGCNASTCEKSTGSCPCKIGFIGIGCDIRCPRNCEDCYAVFYCSACKPGYYGETCQIRCPFGCIDHICHINNGSCMNKICKANFAGSKCDTCEKGKYGEHCQSNCPDNCASCNSDQYCTGCNGGFYGEVCERKCPSNCFQGICTKDGSCSSCSPVQCQTCLNNDDCKYCHENVCQSNCSSCLNLTCRQEDGECLQDFRNGSDGLKCDIGDKGASLTITGLAVTIALIIITVSVYVIFAVKRRQQRSTPASDVTAVNSPVEMNQREYEELHPRQGSVYINLQIGSPQNNQTIHIYDELATNMI